MIPRDDLEEIKMIVTHDDCPDGMASAIVLADALPDAKVVFVQCGAPGLNPVPGLLFCDVTPDSNRAQEFVDAGAWVLDHHEKQRGIVELFGKRGIYSDAKGVSGALLAFENVWVPSANLQDGDYETPEAARACRFATLAGVRDTWQTDSKDWIEACEQAYALLFYPRVMYATLKEPFGKQGAAKLVGMLNIGAVLRLKYEQETKALIENAYCTRTVKGTKLVLVPTEKTSDVAEVLGDEADIVAGFVYKVVKKKLQMRLSFRSHTGVDVGALAVSMGGGGHRAAAGATVHVTNGDVQPYQHVQKLIEDFELGERIGL